MIIAIDACNIRQGGGLIHLYNLLNESNPLNDHKVNMSKVNSIVNIIRNKTNYNLLENV